jgi:hypothetical protein
MRTNPAARNCCRVFYWDRRSLKKRDIGASCLVAHVRGWAVPLRQAARLLLARLHHAGALSSIKIPKWGDKKNVLFYSDSFCFLCLLEIFPQGTLLHFIFTKFGDISLRCRKVRKDFVFRLFVHVFTLLAYKACCIAQKKRFYASRVMFF